MSELQWMLDQHLNIALAEITCFPINKLTPDYCNDSAASLEIQALAIAKNAINYLANLSEVIEPDEPGYQQEGELIAYTLEHTIKMLVATPRQRAEAAYMTLFREN